LGYVLAAAETYLYVDQNQQQFDHIVLPSGSGLTHTGFLVGAQVLGWDVKIHGICVRRSAKSQNVRVCLRAHELVDLMGYDSTVPEENVRVYDDVLQPGYGQLNDQIKSAISLTATHEGVLLDPVYSGRCMAGLIELINQGEIQPNERVMFLHTGGTPALFGYEAELG